jgi:hypothetical protein
MTLKKTNKGLTKGQSILEYFILTAVVLSAVLFFTHTPYFQGISGSCENAFNGSVDKILQ